MAGMPQVGECRYFPGGHPSKKTRLLEYHYRSELGPGGLNHSLPVRRGPWGTGRKTLTSPISGREIGVLTLFLVYLLLEQGGSEWGAQGGREGYLKYERLREV